MKETLDYMSQIISDQHELFFKRMISKVLNKNEYSIRPEDSKDFEIINIEGKDGYGLSYKGYACYWITFQFENTHVKFTATPIEPTASTPQQQPRP